MPMMRATMMRDALILMPLRYADAIYAAATLIIFDIDYATPRRCRHYAMIAMLICRHHAPRCAIISLMFIFDDITTPTPIYAPSPHHAFAAICADAAWRDASMSCHAAD